MIKKECLKEMEKIVNNKEEVITSEINLTESQRIEIYEIITALINSKYVTPYQNEALCCLKNQINKY